VAAHLERELGMNVEKRSGAYGEFTVLVDEQPAVTGGPLGFMGVLPPAGEVLRKVRERLGTTG
jgi:hypothetical protein